MKQKFLPALALVFFFFISNAQQIGHLTVFSEEGDKFFLILNGERQNNKAETNIRVEDLNQSQYSTKIIFEDQTLSEITRTLFIANENGTLMDVTYKVKRDKNGKPKLGALPFSFVEVRKGFVAPSNVYVVHHGAPAPVTTTTVVAPATTVTQTTTTQTTGGAVGANVNVGGVNMNVTINDPLLNTNVTTTHTTTTTHTHTDNTQVVQPTPVGCNGKYPMSSGDFSSALSTVKNQGFDETRLKTAKQIAGGNCLNTNQISEICKVFGFEATKLDFAKFAYDHCTECKNYFKINNVFGFSSSVDELTDYISGRQ